MKIEQIPAFQDNYFYLITCTQTGQTAVIDPGDGQPIIEALGQRQLNAIFNTHHHHDHIGGNKQLKQKYVCKIYAFKGDTQRIYGVDTPLPPNDTLTLGELKFEVIHTPGHTTGHICYYNKHHNALFCGDTLFAGGCGRLFEGTPKMMFESLQKIKELPKNTTIYCAHEYTLSNLLFACHIAPEDPEYKRRLIEVKQLRQQGKPTVPTTLAEELKSNIFLRATTVEEFANLRQQKDNY